MYPSPSPKQTINTVGLQPKFYVRDLKKLIKDTQVGSLIKFEAPVMNMQTGHHHMAEIRGYVEEKYPYIFKLSNGQYYKWVDYLLGYIY